MTQTQAAHNPLLAQLQWVHDMVRRDLAAVRALARDVTGGAPAPAIQDGLLGLRTRGGLFQLRVNCLRYCAFVHEHHTNEDVALFPAVRRSAPHLGATVDRLESDHRVVAGLLDEIEATARGLDGDDTAARARLVQALDTLSAHLLEHLAFEEQALAPVLASWKSWPFHG
jgi:hemerythrin HHE cation binding domain-containing protein